MKKTFVLIACIVLSLPLMAQRTLREGMQQIKDRYDVTFIYDSGIDVDRPYQGSELKGKSLRKDLNTLFAGAGIEASVKKNQVILKKRTPRSAAVFPESSLSEVQLLDSSKIVDGQKPLLTYPTARGMGISEIAVTEATEMLKGRVPGVNVISSLAAPGILPTIYIRGVSASSEATPLYIVDGMRLHSLEGFSPDDIESIEAVKDARVLTLIGPDAAEGAVIIKTKRAGRPGLHVSYEPRVLIQTPAWAPESITLEEINEWRPYDIKEYSADEYMCYSMEEETHTSVSQQHHIGAQYGSSSLSVYAGASFLDQDGLINDAYKRTTGTWSVQWAPLRWMTFTTSGNVASTDLSTDETITWDNLISPKGIPQKKESTSGQWNYPGRRFASFLSGVAAMEARPVKGLSLKLDAGYSSAYEKSAETTWHKDDETASWREPDYMSFTGKENGRGKWQAGAIASYSAEFLGGHNIQAGVMYRHREEKYSLLSAYGRVEAPVNGVEWLDAGEVIGTYFLPEAEKWLEKPGAEWGHLNRITPQMWTWLRDEVAMTLGYDWKGRYCIDGALMRTSVPNDSDPLLSWSVNATWNFVTEPFKGSLRASVGKTDAFCLARNIDNGFDDNVNYDWTSRDILSIKPYILDRGSAERREAGADFEFALAGDLLFSMTLFDNKDVNPGHFLNHKQNVYSVINPCSISTQGLELALGWKGHSGAFRYSAAGNLTLMKNEVVYYKGLVDGMRYKGLYLAEGYPVGAAQLYEFNADYYSYEDYNGNTIVYYNQPIDAVGSYYGGVMPTVCYGIQCSLGWRFLSFTASGHGMSGNSISASQKDSYALWRYYNENYPDGWNNISLSTAMLHNGSFFRIDQLRLDCAVPTGRLPFKASLYASLENFFLFTDYPGTDPEMALMSDRFGAEKSACPTSKRVLTGLKFEF